MSIFWRKLDNTAKFFSLEEKKSNNTFRLSVILKETVDPKILELSLIKSLQQYPSYKVKIQTGFFWNYFKNNNKDPMIQEERTLSWESIDYQQNNDFLFRVTYLNNKINLDILHVLTDGVGATIFLKAILYNYLDAKYKLKTNDNQKVISLSFDIDENIKNADKSLICTEKPKKAFLIKDKYDLLNNKTYHYILDLEKFKIICKKHSVSITEYLTSLYIYAIYKTLYDKSSNKDILVTVPIDLRKYYQVESFSNFFTCMNIAGNIQNNNVSFNKILKNVHKEFKSKLTQYKIKTYLARDVKLGTNLAIRLVPLFIKKIFIKYMNKMTSQSTTTLSNLGPIKVEEQYKKYIDNITVLVSTGNIQKTKCTICSYENKLTIALNSNIINDRLEIEFYNLLKKHVDKFELKNNIN